MRELGEKKLCKKVREKKIPTSRTASRKQALEEEEEKVARGGGKKFL